MHSWMICMEASDSDAPIFPGEAPGLHDLAEWRVLASPDALPEAWGSPPDDCIDAWGLVTIAGELTFDEAVQLAQHLGLQGAPIGG